MGGSGGGGGTFYRSSAADLQRQIRKAELDTAEIEFGPKLAERLTGLLSKINNRDQAKTAERLEDVKEIVQDEITDAFDLRFGGSVAKHTFVDGLSDVDTLLIMRDPEDSDVSPRSFLARLTAKLTDGLPPEVSVSKGRIAVTLTYPDGEEIQIIPAHKTGDQLHVPSWSANDWSPIDPDKFRRGLTKRNAECGMKLVPTIKLAKAINATLPEQQQLTGYHIESMAISAFKGYGGMASVEKMLPYFFERMTELVRSPMRDTSGQSVHVDAYLGKANSEERRQMSHILDRLARRMENATAARSLGQWDSILGDQ